MSVLKLVVLVVITVVLAFGGSHFFGWTGAITGTLVGLGIIVLGGRV